MRKINDYDDDVCSWTQLIETYCGLSFKHDLSFTRLQHVLNVQFIDHPRNGVVYNVGCVCLSVCLSVCQFSTD